MNLFQNHNHCTTARAIYIFRGIIEESEIEGKDALVMTINKPETVLYRAPTFSLLLVSHGGLVHKNNLIQ